MNDSNIFGTVDAALPPMEDTAAIHSKEVELAHGLSQNDEDEVREICAIAHYT